MGWATHDRRAYDSATHKESKLIKENERLRKENADLRLRLEGRRLADAVWDDLRPRPSRVAVTHQEEDETPLHDNELLIDDFTEDYADGGGDA